jgi:hypothetical protein
MLLTCGLWASQIQITDAGRVDINATLWWCQASKNHVALKKYSIVSIILIELRALRESAQLNVEVKRAPELIKDKRIACFQPIYLQDIAPKYIAFNQKIQCSSHFYFIAF